MASELHVADYVVFAIILLLSAAVGPFYMWRDRKQRQATAESYFVGNRALSFIPTAASLFASFWSAIALIGIPAELYTGGAKYFMAMLGQVIGICLGSFFAVPMIYRLKLISTYEYIEMRFESRMIRKIGTIAGVLTSLFTLAVTTYAPCVALEAVSPIPIWASVTGVATVAMFYTVLGGIKAVVLVDFLQAFVMFLGIIIAMVFGFSKVRGGFSRAMHLAYEGGRLDFFDFNADPTNTYSFWAMVIPQILLTSGLYSTSQPAVQRYSALPSTTQARLSVLSMLPQLFVFKLLLFFLALAMFAYYDDQGCDPLRGDIIESPNQLTTRFVVDVLHYPGLVGIWIAALFSGALSSMSTGYNSVAAIIWEDLLKSTFEKKLTPRQTSIVLKTITLQLGITSCILAVGFKALSGSIIKLTLSTVSVFGAAVFICYICGAFFPFANAKGTVCGMIVATMLTSFMSGGQLYYRLGNEQAWLPTQTSNCSIALNETFVPMSNLSQVVEDTGYEWLRDADHLPSVLKFCFSISYFLFPLFAVIIGVIVSIVVSILTGGLKTAHRVSNRYLLVKNCFSKSDNDSELKGKPSAATFTTEIEECHFSEENSSESCNSLSKDEDRTDSSSKGCEL